VSKFIRKGDKPDERVEEQLRRLEESLTKLRREVEKWTSGVQSAKNASKCDDSAADVVRP
jgi:hypothetical protein